MKKLKQRILKLISNILYLFFMKGILFSQGLDDIQFWHVEKFKKNINDKTSLSLEQDFRSGENMSKLLYLHADFGFKRSLNNSYSINLNFREVFEHTIDEEFERELEEELNAPEEETPLRPI